MDWSRELTHFVCALTPCEEEDTLVKSKTLFFFSQNLTFLQSLASTRVSVSQAVALLPLTLREAGTAPAPCNSPKQKPQVLIWKHRTTAQTPASVHLIWIWEIQVERNSCPPSRNPETVFSAGAPPWGLKIPLEQNKLQFESKEQVYSTVHSGVRKKKRNSGHKLILGSVSPGSNTGHRATISVDAFKILAKWLCGRETSSFKGRRVHKAAAEHSWTATAL